MKVLILADIVGKPGRSVVTEVLPVLISTHQPTLVVANFENLAHGSGMTPRTIEEMFDLGIDVATGGNHTWDKRGSIPEIWGSPLFKNRLLRPLNEADPKPGSGVLSITKGGTTFSILNVMGNIFLPTERYTDMLPSIDETLKTIPNDHLVLLDIHAEATSEKAIAHRYLDGRVSVIWGSHTQVATADERLMPQGTAVITDVGMCGAHNEAIGLSYKDILPGMLGGKPNAYGPPEGTSREFNAILVEFDENKRFPSKIERIRRILPPC